MPGDRSRRAGFRVAVGERGAVPFLQRVAALVRDAPRGEAILVEIATARPWTQIVASSEGLSGAIQTLARPFPDSVRYGPLLPAPDPPSTFRDQSIGHWRPDPTGGQPTEPALTRGGPAGPRPLGETRDRWSAGALDGIPGVWMAVQSYWFALGERSVGATFRARLATAPGRGPAARRLAAAWLRVGVEGDGRITWGRCGTFARRRWRSGRLAPWEAKGIVRTPLDRLAASVVRWGRPSTLGERRLTTHLVVLGASGSGKSTFLADLAARRIAARRPTLVVDLHGDLGPALAARWPRTPTPPPLAIDASGPGPPPAVAIWDDEPGDADIAHVVSTLKRISGEGGELYWGFRLDRIYDTVLRAVAAERGGLLDAYDLLTSERRREATRLASRSPEILRFLDELPAILRRNPEFLWPAAARLSRLVQSPSLSHLIGAPAGEGIRLAPRLAAGSSVVLRLPIGRLGPDLAGAVATLVVGRTYFDLARTAGAHRPPVIIVLDEVQALGPRLVAEMLAEGRKFGVGLVIATQYPDRLAPEVRAAAAGAAGAHLVFRVPAAAAADLAPWIGRTREEAAAILPELPDGWALPSTPPAAPPYHAARTDRPLRSHPRAERWAALVHGTGAIAGEEPGLPDLPTGADDAVLLALYAAPGPLPPESLVDGTGARDPGERARALDRIEVLVRRGLIERSGEGLQITSAGARYLGVTSASGAPSESDEHRRLLLEVFLVLARRGERVELLRQGRFDTRLPDARLVLDDARSSSSAPSELLARLRRREVSWAWRFFGGRNVHIEAEVTGADRPARIRRDWEKAAYAGAFLLVVVASPARARRVRSTLDRVAIRDRWSVWTLARAAGRQPHTTP